MPTDETIVEVVLRRASTSDVPAVADLHHLVRQAAVPAMPPSLHPRDDVHRWVAAWDWDGSDVWLAHAGEALAGYARLHHNWLEDLYVDPAVQGTGVGSMLLDLAKSLRPRGFCLWVFESNEPARAFYAHRGCVELERTDGAGNEEKEPDIRVAWPGEDPLAFFRGLIDDVDAQLGDLLARRAALTQVTQAYKSSGSRDFERERAIADAMAQRAPALGADRLTRIVHAIITESLDAAQTDSP